MKYESPLLRGKREKQQREGPLKMCRGGGGTAIRCCFGLPQPSLSNGCWVVPAAQPLPCGTLFLAQSPRLWAVYAAQCTTSSSQVLQPLRSASYVLGVQVYRGGRSAFISLNPTATSLSLPHAFTLLAALDTVGPPFGKHFLLFRDSTLPFLLPAWLLSLGGSAGRSSSA